MLAYAPDWLSPATDIQHGAVRRNSTMLCAIEGMAADDGGASPRDRADRDVLKQKGQGVYCRAPFCESMRMISVYRAIVIIRDDRTPPASMVAI